MVCCKIGRLVGPLRPPVNNPDYEEEFQLAEHLESANFEHPHTKSEKDLSK